MNKFIFVFIRNFVVIHFSIAFADCLNHFFASEYFVEYDPYLFLITLFTSLISTIFYFFIKPSFV